LETTFGWLSSIYNIFDQDLNTTSSPTFVNVTANYYYGDGSLLTGISTSTPNIFDQYLNTTSSVTFNTLNATNIYITENITSKTDITAKMYFENGYLVVEG